MNRGLAILGNTLFMATIDARLVAVDARDGKPLWRTAVAEPTEGYAMTMAPLVVKDRSSSASRVANMAFAASSRPSTP